MLATHTEYPEVLSKIRLVKTLSSYIIMCGLAIIYIYIFFHFLFTLLQELISINIYNMVFTLKAQYDVNCVKSAVKL